MIRELRHKKNSACQINSEFSKVWNSVSAQSQVCSFYWQVYTATGISQILELDRSNGLNCFGPNSLFQSLSFYSSCLLFSLLPLWRNKMLAGKLYANNRHGSGYTWFKRSLGHFLSFYWPKSTKEDFPKLYIIINCSG